MRSEKLHNFLSKAQILPAIGTFVFVMTQFRYRIDIKVESQLQIASAVLLALDDS